MKILITGASSGIGAACAHLFATKGWEVLLAGRDASRLASVADALPGHGHQCLQGDILEWAAHPTRLPELGQLDALVWSAGICKLAPGMMLNEKPLRQTLAVNLEAPLLVTSYLYRKKILQDGSTIVWLGSQSAHDAGEGFSMYAASKAGLAAAARVLNKEFARRNIQIHCIEPGTVDTPMTQTLIEQFGGLKDGHADSILSPEAVAKEIFAKTQTANR